MIFGGGGLGGFDPTMSASRIPYEPIGRRIKRLRKQRGWNQQELADRVGLHYTTVGDHERGDTDATLAVAIQYADVLEVTLDALVGRSEDGLLAVVRDRPIHILPKNAVKVILSAKSWADLRPMWVDAGVHIGSVVHPEDDVVDERVYRDTQAKIRKIVARLGPEAEESEVGD